MQIDVCSPSDSNTHMGYKMMVVGKKPSPRYLHHAFMYNDRLHIVGGFDSHKGILSDVWRIDVSQPTSEALSWEQLSPLETEFAVKTFRNTGTLMKDRLIILGGKTNKATNEPSIAILDLQVTSWLELHADPKDLLAIDSHTTVPIKDQLLVFGGYIHDPKPRTSSDTYLFDLQSLKYHKIPTQGDVPSPRYGHGAEMVDKDRMVIFGGFAEGYGYSDEFYILDVNTWIWSRLRLDGQIPSPRTGFCMGVYNDRVWLLGGHTEISQEQASIYIVDINKHECKCREDTFKDEIPDPEELLRSISPPRSPSKERNSPYKSPSKSDFTFISGKSPPGTTLSGEKVTVESLKKERLIKKKAEEKKKLLSEFDTKKIPASSLHDKDLLKMQNILQTLSPDKKPLPTQDPFQDPSRLKPLRPGVSIFSQTIGSRLQRASLPRVEGPSICFYRGWGFVFGGDRAGLCSNELFIVDVESVGKG